jgi:hypothetical protein
MEKSTYCVLVQEVGWVKNSAKQDILECSCPPTTALGEPGNSQASLPLAVELPV